MSNDYQHMIQQTLFWMFVPSLISSVLMRVYTYIAGGGVKKSSSATAAANAATAHRNRIYNRIYITVVLAYLLYSFIQVFGIQME